MTKSFWIKERENPQIGIYYTACGQLSKTAAKKMEKSIYGTNTMLEYQTEKEYKKALTTLKLN